MKNNCIKITTLLVPLLFGAGISMANNTALSSGAWETGANWSSGAAPLATDIVVVAAGLTMTVKATGDACASLTIAATGSVIINANESLSIGGSFSNAGTFTANAGSTLTFNGAANSTLTGGGTYTIAGTVVLNMGSAATALDVQDANFISGINSGGNYYMSFIQGTWKMDNAGTLNDCYNSGSANALTIAYGVVIESDAGTMNLCKNAPTGSAILSGKLFMNGGIINVQTGQGFNSGQDFQYHGNGGTPQLYISSGTLNIGAGLNANGGADYIDFHMIGGTMILALNGYSNWITFQLADVAGGKTFMSGGLVILQDACNANIEDIDMGGANVAATQYSVTGGTVQLGYVNTQSSSTYFGIDAQPATNYPNFDFEPGVAKNASAFSGGNINMLSLHVNSNMTFDATGFPNVNIMSSNGTFAFDDEGGFIQSTNTVTFSGSENQVISSTSLANEAFYNLNIANTSGHVTLAVATTVANQLSFTSGLVDASNYSLTLSNGSNAITGASSSSYVITGNGVATTGKLNINTIPASTSTIFPIGTSTYYLPTTINPGTNSGNSYSAFVFQGATTNAAANGTPFSAAGLAQIVNAVWNISQTAGSGTASLTLNWASSGTVLEGSIFQTEGLNIGISQYIGGWQLATGSGNVSTATATSSFNSFTQFGVGGINQILPVTISDFAAFLKNNNTVLLSWSASDNVGISDFEVQTSTNNSDWHTIGTVQAQSGANAESNYSFIDASPGIGMNYYRLLIQNADGTYSYSPIRQVTSSTIAYIGVFPNPANNIINVTVGNAGTTFDIRLISLSGQLLQSARYGSPIISINVCNYPSGIYLLQVVSPDRILQTSSVIIAH